MKIIDENGNELHNPDLYMGYTVDNDGSGELLIYYPYTGIEGIQRELALLHKKLADTDYIIIKISEEEATWDEYPTIREQRREWRNRIRELENTEDSD